MANLSFNNFTASLGINGNYQADGLAITQSKFLYHNPCSNYSSVNFNTITKIEHQEGDTDSGIHEGYLDSVIDAIMNETVSLKTAGYLTTSGLSTYLSNNHYTTTSDLPTVPDVSNFITTSDLTKANLPNDIVYTNNGSITKANNADNWINTFTTNKTRIETLSNVFKGNSYSNVKSLEARIEETELKIGVVDGTIANNLQSLSGRITTLESTKHWVGDQTTFNTIPQAEIRLDTIYFIYEDQSGTVTPSLSISPSALLQHISANGGQITVAVTSNVAWQIDTTTSTAGLTYSASSGNNQNSSNNSTSIIITVPQNETSSSKNYQVNFKTVQTSSATAQLTFVLDGVVAPVTPSATISASNQTITSAQTNVTITVDVTPANVSWVISNNVDNVTQSGQGDGSASFTIPALDSLNNRNVVFTITQLGDNTALDTETIVLNGATPQVSVSTNTMTFDASGNTNDLFTITKSPSDLVITGSSNQSWCHYSNGVISVDNYSVENGTRTATVTIGSSNATLVNSPTIMVTQNGPASQPQNVQLSIRDDSDPRYTTASCISSNNLIYVDTNLSAVNATGTVNGTTLSGLTFSQYYDSKDECVILTASIPENLGSQRQIVITVSDPNNASTNDTITITQDAFTPILTLQVDDTINNAQQTLSVDIVKCPSSSNVTLTSDSAWCTVSGTNLQISANTTGTPRMCTIQGTLSGYPSATTQLTIFQSSANTVDDNTFSIYLASGYDTDLTSAAHSQEGMIMYDSGYDIDTSSIFVLDGASWFTIDSVDGKDEIICSTTANTSSASRTAKIVAWTRDFELRSNVVTITQSGSGSQPVQHTLTTSDSTTLNLTASDTTAHTITFTSDSNNLSASSDSQWVTASISNKVLTITPTANSGTARTANITVVHGDDNSISVTVVVNQAAGQSEPQQDVYVLSAPSNNVNITAAGGEQSGIQLTSTKNGNDYSNLTCEVAQSAQWLSAMVTGLTLVLTAQANTGALRSTTVTVSQTNGQSITITVTQAAGLQEQPVALSLTIDGSTFTTNDVLAANAKVLSTSAGYAAGSTTSCTITGTGDYDQIAVELLNDGTNVDYFTVSNSGSTYTFTVKSANGGEFDNTSARQTYYVVKLMKNNTAQLSKTIKVIQNGHSYSSNDEYSLEADGITNSPIKLSMLDSSNLAGRAVLTTDNQTNEQVLTLESGLEYTLHHDNNLTTFNGQIRIVKDDDDYEDTKLNLDGVSISTSKQSAIEYVLDPNTTWDDSNKSKRRGLIIHSMLTERDNTLISNNGTSQYTLQDGQKGAINSDNNLVIEGSGLLRIQNKAGHGVRAAGDLTLAEVDTVIDASHDAFHSNDALKIENGLYYIQHANNIFDANDAMYVIKPEISLSAANVVSGQTFKCADDNGSNTIYILEQPVPVDQYSNWSYSAPTNYTTTVNSYSWQVKAFVTKPSSWNNSGDLEINSVSGNAITIGYTSGDTINISNTQYKYFVLEGEFTLPIKFWTEIPYDVTVVLNGVDAHNSSATTPFIFNGAAKEDVNDPEMSGINVVVAGDTLNRIDWQYSGNNASGYDLDAIKCEGNIKIEPKGGSLTYIHSTADCVDGKDVTVTDGNGDLVLVSDSERGIKGTNVCIGANLSSKQGTWSVKSDNGSDVTDSFGGILIAKKTGAQVQLDTTSTATKKASGYTGIFARNGKASSGYFAIVASQLIGKGIILASGLGVVTNYSSYYSLSDVKATPQSYYNENNHVMPINKIQVWYPNVWAVRVDSNTSYVGSHGINQTNNGHGSSTWFSN